MVVRSECCQHSAALFSEIFFPPHYSLTLSSRNRKIFQDLKESELLLGGAEDLIGLHLERVEADGLGEGAALSCGHDVTFLEIERRADVDGDVGVTLLVSVKLLDVVQISTTNDSSVGHLTSRDAHTLHNATTNRNVTSERTLFVNPAALLGGARSGETKTDVTVVTGDALSLGGGGGTLGADEDGVLLLKGLLVLFSHLFVI